MAQGAKPGEGGQDRAANRSSRLRCPASPEQQAKVEHRRRLRQPCWKIAAVTGLSIATVTRVAKRKGLSRLSALDPKPLVIRYEKEHPGDMIHIDIKNW